MILFVLFVFIVYGGVHAYAFIKARQAFALGWGAGAGIALFMALMVGAVFLIRTLERHEHELTARALSYVAYLWMAGLFLFFCGSLVIDLLNLCSTAMGWTGWHAAGSFRVGPRISFLVSVVLSLSICVYGYFEAQNIRTERIVIQTSKLPQGIDRLTIAQISDVHLGLIIRCDRLVGILEAVKAARPDILVSTGDLVDAQINHLAGLRELLQDIRPRYGKFAVTGNHEYFAGLETSLEFTRESGFLMLRGESKDIGVITLAGVDDRTAFQVQGVRPVSDRRVLDTVDHKKFILFLKHQPTPDPDAVGLFDLMLSGHTHKGQIWPFTYLARMSYPRIAGTYDLGKGSILAVSRGSGTWGPPIRFLAPPEITIIELVRKG